MLHLSASDVKYGKQENYLICSVIISFLFSMNYICFVSKFVTLCKVMS